MIPSIPLVIVIGGSDPSGGAGIQADLSTLCALGIPAKSIVTALTAQNEKKFLGYQTVPLSFFKQQLASLSKIQTKIVAKIGMIGKGRLLPALFAWLHAMHPSQILLDPVLQSSTRADLIDPVGADLLREKYLFQADLLTPNLLELEFFSRRRICNPLEMEKAAQKILEESQRRKGRLRAIFAKGGHLPGKPVDLLVQSDHTLRWEGERVRRSNVHGTGCTLASAIAGYLALGNRLADAVRKARGIVRKKIESAPICES